MSARHVVFITGGTSGIGLGLAKALHECGNKVIIGGRNTEALLAIAREFPGIETIRVDVADSESIAACGRELEVRFPTLNMLINNAGVQHVIDFSAANPHDIEILNVEIDCNLRGVVQMVNVLLPLLKGQPQARIVNVSSGLAFLPRTQVPIYCATKAAVHSFTISLRHQLRNTSVRVSELIPPLVKTQLHRHHPLNDPRAMDLDIFVSQAIRALDSGRNELPIGLAKVLRIGSRVVPGLFFRIINT